MKSDIEIKDIVYEVIKGSELEQTIIASGGKVYKLQRPATSNKEDIVISVSDGLNGQIQSAVVEVDIYVPYSTTEILEDETRIRDLTSLAANLLEDKVKDDFRFTIEKQIYKKVDGKDEHCINNRLTLQTLNY